MDYPFADSPAGQTTSFTLTNNLYWNNGTAIPYSGSDVVNYTDDANRIEAFVPAGGAENHAANLLALPNGDLLCTWMAGSARFHGW